jgi:hypothetical protein
MNPIGRDVRQDMRRRQRFGDETARIRLQFSALFVSSCVSRSRFSHYAEAAHNIILQHQEYLVYQRVGEPVLARQLQATKLAYLA